MCIILYVLDVTLASKYTLVVVGTLDTHIQQDESHCMCTHVYVHAWVACILYIHTVHT